MPVLIRIARAADVPEGAEKRVKARGCRFVLRNAGARFETRDAEGRSYRTEVRGDHVYVAVDPDANAAPAEIQPHGGGKPAPRA